MQTVGGMDVHFTIEKQPEVIQQIIELCDSSFMVGITHRENYLEIRNKMQRFAEFIVPRFDDGTPLGYVSMYANNKETKSAYISMFCIRPEFQKHHLGTLLMDKAAEVAQKNGMLSIKLEVLRENTKAQNFYLNYGFQIVEKEDKDSFFMLYYL